MVEPQSLAKGKTVSGDCSTEDVLRDFEKLIQKRELFGAARDPSIMDGAEFDPALVRKKGKGSRFLIRKPPSRRTLLRRWTRIFGRTISPCALIDALSVPTHGFEHRNRLLLFGRARILYDADIFHGEENVGELTLSFASSSGLSLGVLAFGKGARKKIVRIEHIQLTAQKSGYASALFHHYEQLFRDLAFDEFRLSASLSVGKYYWAKEGFNFADESEIARRKEALRALVNEKGLPVGEAEIERLGHASDFAGFAREVRVPVYRDAEGYYSFKADDRFREEVILPLGKAFLLSGAPWDGYKVIPAPGTNVAATSALESGRSAG